MCIQRKKDVNQRSYNKAKKEQKIKEKTENGKPYFYKNGKLKKILKKS